MDQHLQDCLNNKKTDYIFPFFWQQKQEHSRLLEEMEAMKKSGVNSFCVESRTHEAFCEDPWWEDFGFILKTAKEMDMKVWLLDDKHFPTGYALGTIQEKYPHLRKHYFRQEVVDVLGPQKDCALLTNFYTQDGDRVLRAVAYQRTGEGLDCDGPGIDLTAHYEDDLVRFDIPEGMWRVFFVLESDRLQTKQPYFIDMLNPESTRLMLTEIYEPHYRHFKEYFGNTLVGFFSDEPGFGNEYSSYASNVGNTPLLPYSDKVVPRMAKLLSLSEEEVWRLIPALWANIGEATAKVRVAYMDTVTELYAKNFTQMLSNWCREHGVMYIGHIIEDMNANMHLGNSAGHYFRALDAQSMSGVDVVLHQIMPGQNQMLHTARIYDRIADPAFFVYALAKLGASHSHINPAMKNRAMCEIYGAYGYAEGLPFMKKLSDHFLANGINRYVPHAFTPEYPSDDCPPHFYAGGMNPQFELFGQLMRYMQRVIHLMENSVHQATALVYYNAECEWAGSKTDLYYHVAKALTQSQIDFDFVPRDYLASVRGENGKLFLNEESYSAMILPGCTHLSAVTDAHLQRLFEAGVPVIFCGSLPEKLVEGGEPACRRFALCVPSRDLGRYLRQRGLFDLSLSTPCPFLRCYHVTRDGKDIYMFKNDGETPLCTELSLKQTGDVAVYDAWRNTVRRKSDRKLHLAAGESALWILGEDCSQMEEEKSFRELTATPAELLWDVEIESVEDKVRTPYLSGVSLHNLAGKNGLTHFAGKLFYRSTLTLDSLPRFLDLGYVGETAKLTVNGKDCGTLIAEPYCFDVEDAVKQGDNRLEIEVVTSPVYRERDAFSRYMKILPMGILGPVSLLG